MRVVREIVTVLTDPATGEVSIVLSGWRITLTADEADLLARGLANGLEELRGAQRPESGATPELRSPGRSSAGSPDREPQHIVAPLATDPEAIQQRTRALIQASIRDKGLSLREESSA